MSTSPLRLLREALAASLAGLGVEVSDVLPDHVNPPHIAVGIPSYAPSGSVLGLYALTVPVSVVGHRADFSSSQLDLDDLVWVVKETLEAGVEGFSALVVTSGDSFTLESAGQSFPAYTWTLEASLIC